MTINYIKKKFRIAIAFIFWYSGLSYLMLKYSKKKIIVLLYHGIDDNRQSNFMPEGMLCHSKKFEQHLQLTTRLGKVISLNDFYKLYHDKQNISENYFVITLDDGFKSVCHNALPLLIKYNISACFFLATDMINAQDLLPMHKFYLLLKLIQLDEVIKIIKQKYPHISIENENSRDSNNVIQFRNMLERQLGFQIGDLEGKALIDFILEEFKFDSSRKMAKELYLNWNDVIKMKNSGMLIGSHTCSHRVLGKLGIQEQKYEILESKKILERHLHDQIDFFAYPFGYQESFNDKTKEILSKNNFSCAFAGVGRVDRKKGFDRYEIPRFLVKDSPIWEFSFEIWRYGWRNPWNIKN